MLPETFIIELINTESGSCQKVLITDLGGTENKQPSTQIMQLDELFRHLKEMTESVEIKIVVIASPICLLKITDNHLQHNEACLPANCEVKFGKRQMQYWHYTFTKLMSPDEIATKLEISINRVYQISQECYVLIGCTNAAKLSEIFLQSHSDWVDPDKYPII